MSYASALGYRWFGFLECNKRHGFRTTWLQVVPRFGLSLMLTNREKDYGGPWARWWSLHFCALFGEVYVDLPLPRRKPRGEDCFGDSWGFTYFERSIHFHWGTRVKIVDMPWSWQWYRTSYLLPNGIEWIHRTSKQEYKSSDPFKTWQEVRDTPKWERVFDYTYKRRSGEVQKVKATVRIEVYERRLLALFWLPLFARTTRCISIDFSDEIGERTGSWKGGVVGCGYDMKPGESAEEALRRMERERRFE